MDNNKPLYPNVKVQLVNGDGNAFAIMGKVKNALQKAGHRDAAEDFMDEAISGDYDNLLQTCMKYVVVR
jgi:hypothetical protein